MSSVVGQHRLIVISLKRSVEINTNNDLHAYIYKNASADVFKACVPAIAQFQEMRNDALFKSSGNDQLNNLSR
jgi:hypothetical protein